MTGVGDLYQHLGPTLAAGEAGPLALNLLKVLACAGVIATVFGRLRLNPIPAYLIAGTIIGPHALGLVDDVEQIGGMSDLAIVLLMFGIGLHLDASHLRRGASSILLIGVVSTALSTALIGASGLVFGLDWRAALALGMALSLSSTAVVLRLIQGRRELGRAYGRLSFGVLLVQDLAVILMLSLLPTLAPPPAEGESAVAEVGAKIGVVGGWEGILVALLTVAMMLVLGRAVLPRLMGWLARRVGVEVLLVVSAAIALGAAVASGAVGLAPALGSFIAGFLLAETPVRYQLSGQLTPLRDLFMAVFFTAVGLTLDLPAIADSWWALPAGLAVVIVIKLLSIGLTSWAFGVIGAVSAHSAFALAQAGEFSLVVLEQAGNVGILSAADRSGASALVVISLILTPMLMDFGGRIAPRLGRVPAPPWCRVRVEMLDRVTPLVVESGGDLGGDAAGRDVVVAGFGPVGRAVVEKLDAGGARVTVIELNPATIRRQALLGRPVIYGDVTNPEVLENAGVPKADAVVLTIPDDDAMLRAVRTIRDMAPDALIVVRASVLSRGMQATELGANQVTVEEMAAASAMADQVIDAFQRFRDATPTTPSEPAPPHPDGAEPAN
ncbi:MAG: cation:proton antiporter [Planctomycetota bacterium]